MPEEFQQEIKEKAQVILTNEVFPALQRLSHFLSNEYIPNCRESIAISDLPNGQEWYRQSIKSYTTTSLSPETIHQMGLEEVDRIQREMEAILVELDFQGTIKEFFDFLRAEPSFYFAEKSELIQGYADLLHKIEAKLPDLFGKLPTTPYQVQAIPESCEEQAVGAYYVEGSLSTNRPGSFFVNTSDLNTRPKWEMAALALHEALPGHHLQVSLALENKALPEFRSLSSFTAYIEGWALYAEGLGQDLGVYQDPYARFGRLNMEMLRAARLVIDTGIHAFGWSRQEAIDYSAARSGVQIHEIVTEIDRYITWPGQALAYKIGELKILEMRRLAEEKLGGNFDIKAFHDEVLRHGALPLNIFESRMVRWIDSQSNLQ